MRKPSHHCDDFLACEQADHGHLLKLLGEGAGPAEAELAVGVAACGIQKAVVCQDHGVGCTGGDLEDFAACQRAGDQGGGRGQVG